MKAMPLLGRLLLAAIFLESGVSRLLDWDSFVALLAAKHLAVVPILLSVAVAAELGLGLMLLAGYKVRWAALLLIAYLIPGTLLFHEFWLLDGAARTAELGQFLKNLGLMGGLFQVIAFGAGPLSVDSLDLRRQREADAARMRARAQIVLGRRGRRVERLAASAGEVN